MTYLQASLAAASGSDGHPFERDIIYSQLRDQISTGSGTRVVQTWICCSHKQHHLTAGGHHGIANYNCNILISLTLPLQARPPGSEPAAMLAITSLAPCSIIMRATMHGPAKRVAAA